jgi:hypothetical protein
MGNITYLKYQDYSFLIQKEDLFQILGEKRTDTWDSLCTETKTLLLTAEQEGITEMKSYISDRYNTEYIFTNTQDYSSGTTYFGKNLIQYSEQLFSTGTTYSQGDRFAYKQNIYEQVSTGTTSGITTPNTATTIYSSITENNSLYYANLPCSEYNQYTTYTQGAIVWFEDNIYQAKQNVRGKVPSDSQNLELRYGVPGVQSYLGVWPSSPINTNPQPNVDTNNWSLYNGDVSSWFTGTTYYFTGITPTDTTYWTKGDNRNAQIKMYLIDIILYHLHSRINPRNIPELRNIRYDGANEFKNGGAIGWLKQVENGKVGLDAPKRVPNDNKLSIAFGSFPKLNNHY